MLLKISNMNMEIVEEIGTYFNKIPGVLGILCLPIYYVVIMPLFISQVMVGLIATLNLMIKYDYSLQDCINLWKESYKSNFNK